METSIFVWIWVHSGGTDPKTGELSEASLERMAVLLECLDNVAHKDAEIRLILSGEQTRKSGPWPQCDKLRDYVLEHRPEYADRILTFALSTGETFRTWSLMDGDCSLLLFINDEVHMERYLDTFRLIAPALEETIVAYAVPVTEEYYKKYSRYYVLCYNALGYMQLALQYAKVRRLDTPRIVWKAFWRVCASVWFVGLEQFVLFGMDRKINKETTDPKKLKRLAYIREHLDKDLLGENE